MSNCKNYNSIVFLTTLSVYLGLVLVGATPSILAQAALTRDFDIKHEIVVEDDLDKKPDDVTAELKSKTDKPDDQFIEQYAKAILALLKQNYTSGVYSVKLDGSGVSSEFDELFNELAPKVKKELTFNGFTATEDKDNFFSKYQLKLRFDNTDISSFIASFNASLNFLLRESLDKPENLVIKNTEVIRENNQVFIVTRLPRGSIDSLLAQKDAQ